MNTINICAKPAIFDEFWVATTINTAFKGHSHGNDPLLGFDLITTYV
jgi:hypothetical protein